MRKFKRKGAETQRGKEILSNWKNAPPQRHYSIFTGCLLKFLAVFGGTCEARFPFAFYSRRLEIPLTAAS
jgi:hypothetical protein